MFKLIDSIYFVKMIRNTDYFTDTNRLNHVSKNEASEEGQTQRFRHLFMCGNSDCVCHVREGVPKWETYSLRHWQNSERTGWSDQAEENRENY